MQAQLAIVHRRVTRGHVTSVVAFAFAFVPDRQTDGLDGHGRLSGMEGCSGVLTKACVRCIVGVR